MAALFGVIARAARDEQTARREAHPDTTHSAASNCMTEPLGRRCALVLMASMTLAAATGLIAWGPILLTADMHRYADSRTWLGMITGANAWVHATMFVAGAWGRRATRESSWATKLRRPWQLFHLCAMLSAAMAGVCHARSSNALFLLAHVSMAGGFMMLTSGLLAERGHARFGSSLSCGVCLLGVGVTGYVMLLVRLLGGSLDLRLLMLLELIPLLVIPAGALSLPGRSTRASHWIVVLSLYVLAKVLGTADAAILETSGWISGHTLQHLR